ncbi:MAG: mechanosensitive ion channel domain-containing protein [Limibaculum sp.]
MAGVASHAPESRADNREPARAVRKHLEGGWLSLSAWRCCLFLVLAALAIAQFTPAAAGPDAADPLATLLEQARADGLRIIILEPGGEGAEAGDAAAARPGLGHRATDLTGRLVQRFGEVIDAAPGQFSDFVAKVASLSPDQSAMWLVWVVLVGVIGFGLGGLLYVFLCRSLIDRMRPAVASAMSSRRVRIDFTAITGAVALAGLALEVVLGVLLPVIVFGRAPHTSLVISTVVEVAVVLRLSKIFFDLLLVPNDTAMRLVTIGDDAAQRFHRHIRNGLPVIFVLLLPALLFLNIETLPRELKVLVAIVGVGGAAAVSCVVVWANRLGIAQLFSGGRDGSPSLLARNAWIITIAYFVVAWFISSVRRLLDYPDASGLVGAPLVAVMIACLIRGAGILLAEHFIHARSLPQISADDEAADDARDLSGRSHWVDQMARLVAVGVAVLFVVNIWGVSFVQDDGSAGFLGISAVTVFLAYAGWTAIRSYFDRKIAEEIGDVSSLEGDEGGGAGVSRLGTLLPLVRNVILFAVMFVAVMVLLIDIGIDIAPLFAGAGILAFAIGFGAQTLIRDIFSGLFFLIDDAFRAGEYVDTGNAKGTVERISIRSMQLRHHNGPLYTVPFGEIQQLTNYSRDWVIMKLPLRLTLDTDPERVRKMVKKLGQELLGDPMVGHKFLQPLKSQGVLSIDNFGMVVRIKFMTKPGDQFVTRRVVYARIHELFEREGVEFASRDVRIRMDKASEAGGEIARAAAVAAELAEAVSPDDPAAGAGKQSDDER